MGRAAADDGSVSDEDPADLLNAWRDATRAAELAERLATIAAESLARADLRATESAEIARLADQAAESAATAAARARFVAAEAARQADELRASDGLHSEHASAMRTHEDAAERAYRDGNGDDTHHEDAARS